MSTVEPGKFVVTSQMKGIYAVLMFVGAAGFIFTLINDSTRAWMAYLVAFFYFMTLALGGLFFTAIQHVTKAGWSVNVRRYCESFTSFLPFGAVAAVVLLFGAPELYKWMQPEAVAGDHLLQHKAGYLNSTFFYIRMALFFGLWIWFAKVIVGKSLEQDKTGDEGLTHKLVGISIACVLVFALSYSLFSIDTMMSIEAHWFSTIFGVYTFAGMFQSTMAFMILLILYSMKKGWLKGLVDENHLHDLGKFMFAFTVFWAYIAFSQFMLIWYANLPEETIFYIPRSHGAWGYVSVFLIIFRFVVPFLALLPRWAKRTPGHLAALSILILVMQFVDLYWLAYPSHEKYHHHAVFGLPEILTFLGFLGAFLFVVTRFLSRHSLVPLKDPRQHESLHHEVVY